jgi:hypothetical protein
VKVFDNLEQCIMIFDGFFPETKMLLSAEFKSAGISEISHSVLELEANTFTIF